MTAAASVFKKIKSTPPQLTSNNTMAQQSFPCENCKFRAQYDKDPKSFQGRFWRWHINFCPGWKAYFTHQDEQTKAALREKYDFKKYQ